MKSTISILPPIKFSFLGSPSSSSSSSSPPPPLPPSLLPSSSSSSHSWCPSPRPQCRASQADTVTATTLIQQFPWKPCIHLRAICTSSVVFAGAGAKCPIALVTFPTTVTKYQTTAPRGRKCSVWFSVPGDTGQHGKGMQASQMLVCGYHAGITHELMVMIGTYRADHAGCQAEGQSPNHALLWCPPHPRQKIIVAQAYNSTQRLSLRVCGQQAHCV